MSQNVRPDAGKIRYFSDFSVFRTLIESVLLRLLHYDSYVSTKNFKLLRASKAIIIVHMNNEY